HAVRHHEHPRAGRRTEVFQQRMALVLPEPVQDGNVIAGQVAGQPGGQLRPVVPWRGPVTQRMNGIIAIAQGGAVRRIQANPLVGNPRNRQPAYHGPYRLANPTRLWVHIRKDVQYLHDVVCSFCSSSQSIRSSSAAECVDETFRTNSLSLARIASKSSGPNHFCSDRSIRWRFAKAEVYGIYGSSPPCPLLSAKGELKKSV